MKMKTVMVVDDGEEERTTFSRYLEFAGAHVLAAGNGESALALVSDERPDVILLALDLPGEGGWRMMERLRSDPAVWSIPVVALCPADAERERVERAGFSDCLLLPAAPNRVLEVVEHWVGRLDAPWLEAESASARAPATRKRPAASKANQVRRRRSRKRARVRG